MTALTAIAAPTPAVSVIVCTRDRPRDLARCLPTVLENDHASFEVIVIDQSVGDESAAAVREAAEAAGRALVVASGETAETPSGPVVVYKRSASVGLNPARNEGARLARGEILAFTDDDCTADQGWLTGGTRALEDRPEVGILFGKFAPIPHDYKTTYVPYFLPQRFQELDGPDGAGRWPAVAGANMFVRREAFERVNGFDECLGPGCRFRGGDDDDFAYRVLRTGYSGLIDPLTVVLHWGARAFGDGSGQRLLRDYYHGIGARLIKQIRCGDAQAARELVTKVNRAVWFFLGNVVTRRRLTGAGRLAALFAGVLRGLRYPIDRERWLYVPQRRNGKP